jgi:hypothetical protein
MKKIFTLANGRSGTKFLSEIFKSNVKNCVSKHEPTPSLFGEPIYWYNQGKTEEIKKLFIEKKKKIERYNKDVYIETNHAFLKSFSDVAMEFFSDMKLIHLIRNPLKAAKSEINRKNLLFTLPLYIILPIPRFYIGDDGKKYFKWSLTGNEEIFRDFTGTSISHYQWYVIQWIEIENRAVNFLNKYNKHNDCYILNSPRDLNDPDEIKNLFDFMEVELKNENIIIRGKKNKNKVPTAITEEEKRQFQEAINLLSDKYLKIFREKPYKNFEWTNLLRKT